MTTYSVAEIIRFARENSPYYRELYANIPNDAPLASYPLIEMNSFWEAVRMKKVLTSAAATGKLLNSGGTTGNPKLCPYTREEWQTMCALLAAKNDIYIWEEGDIALNIFFAGNLYGSYDFISQMYACSKIDYQFLNAGGHIPIADIVHYIIAHDVTVIIGPPSLIFKVVKYIDENDMHNTHISKIYYGGETLQRTARGYIDKVLGKKIDYRSIGLAGNDYGQVAYFGADCGFNEHRADDEACVFELIEGETGEIITEEDRVGKVYITSLFKRFMPLIRYPIGDDAIYTEPPSRDRKFRLMGRSDDAARVGFVSVYCADIEACIDALNIHNGGYQMVATHEENALDMLTIKVATKENIAKILLEELYSVRPALLESTQKRLINETRVEACDISMLEYNQRTGKLKHVIDKRFV